MLRNLRKRKELTKIIRKIVRTYGKDEDWMQHLGETPLPSEDSIIGVVQKLRNVLFPGYFIKEHDREDNIESYASELVYDVHEGLTGEIYKVLHQSCKHGVVSGREDGDCEGCQENSAEVSLSFASTIPGLRQLLSLDLEAAIVGDPAAKSYNEIILSYPGTFAVIVYRIAHELVRLKVPLIPRMMTEYAHRETGIDIHPGARIGRSFFIDHGTGVVIGETTRIGNNVKIYQGVTLGALSLPRERGSKVPERKRHPTVEDNVIIYSGATILGGNTIIGRDSVIGGNVWIVSSVPPKSKVLIKVPKLNIEINE